MSSIRKGPVDDLPPDSRPELPFVNVYELASKVDLDGGCEIVGRLQAEVDVCTGDRGDDGSCNVGGGGGWARGDDNDDDLPKALMAAFTARLADGLGDPFIGVTDGGGGPMGGGGGVDLEGGGRDGAVLGGGGGGGGLAEKG